MNVLDVFCKPGEDVTNIFSTANSSGLPLLNKCVLHGTLIYLPSIFLLIFSPLIIYDLNKQKPPRILTCFTPSTFRLMLCTILEVVVFVMLLNAAHQAFYQPQSSETPLAYETVGLVLLSISLSWAFFLTVQVRLRGLIASGTLFLFYFLLAFCSLPEALYLINHVMNGNKITVHGVLFLAHTFLVHAIMLCCFFAERPAQKPKNKVCPEDYSSFPFQISYEWLTGLIWRGYHNGLTFEDLWDLNARDRCDHLWPDYERHRRTEEMRTVTEENLQKTKNRKKTDPHVTKVTLNGSTENQALTFDHSTEGEDDRKCPSVLWPLAKTFKFYIIGGFFLKFFFDSLQFVSPVLLKYLIIFVERGTEPTAYGVGIVLSMFLTATIQSFIIHYYFHIMFRVGMNIRSILSAAVYRKAINMSNKARKNRTVGELVNILAGDVQRFQDITTYAMMIWSAPYQMILALVFLFQLLGWCVVIGLTVLILLLPFNSLVSKRIRKCQTELAKCKDKRLRFISEVVSGIKMVKLYGWEKEMEAKILGERKREIQHLKHLAYLNAVTSLSWACAPFLVAVTTFGVYVLIDPANNRLTPQTTFVALSLFNILRFPMAVCTVVFTQVATLLVSNKRLKVFLASEEVQKDVAEKEDKSMQDENLAISINNGTFSWDANDYSPQLRNLNLTVQRGQLVAVVGRIGSGKTNLLQAILGEMNQLEGDIRVNGSVAYVPQQAWIQNDSLRNNVLFGKEWKPAVYGKVLDVCALTKDLESLTDGDLTEIGEKGINLSGGQKQRISLARSVYCDAEIYLLDDVLSAVDAHVGRHIFEYAIAGELAGKTRIFVTHSLAYLKHCDVIVVMKGGQISECGSYDKLLRQNGEFADILEEFLMEKARHRGRSISFGEDANDVKEVLSELEKNLRQPAAQKNNLYTKDQAQVAPERNVPVITVTAPSTQSTPVHAKENAVLEKGTKVLKTAAPASGKLIEGESVQTGKVSWAVYASYARAIGRFVVILFLVIYLCASALGVFSNMWLADWSDEAAASAGSYVLRQIYARLGVYTLLGLGQAVFVCTAAVLVSLGMVHASWELHENMLRGVLGAPMWFFDVTPLGRILNRFSKDLDMVDSRLPSSVLNFTGSIIQGLAIICVPVIVTPQAAPALLLILVLYVMLAAFYLSTSRQLKRLEAESIQGASSIRAYNCEKRFIQKSQDLVDQNLKAYYPSIAANRWLSVRLELIGNSIVFVAGIYAVLFRDTGVTAGLIGLSVSYALNVTQTLNWAVRMSSELETNIVCVERIEEYADNSNTEESSGDVINTFSNVASWPKYGKIKFENVWLAYRAGLEPVLRDLNVEIRPNEKIGIVGRTGKSTLSLALLRIVDPCRGKVCVDDVDLRTVPLHIVRQRLTVVPQDPVLFSGTLRFNLDPLGGVEDADLWEALRLAGMYAFVESLPKQLNTEIHEGGANISVGQRQLICLARALLRKPKVLVLDEASASVDMETDHMVHRTLREHFKDCTVLTIAHRLNHMHTMDRILALDNGRVAEFDTPANLMARKDSVFNRLSSETELNPGFEDVVPKLTTDNVPNVEITLAEVNQDDNESAEESPLLISHDDQLRKS